MSVSMLSSVILLFSSVKVVWKKQLYVLSLIRYSPFYDFASEDMSLLLTAPVPGHRMPYITKTRLCNILQLFTAEKGLFSNEKKNVIVFLFKTLDFGYALGVPTFYVLEKKIRKMYTPVNPTFPI